MWHLELPEMKAEIVVVALFDVHMPFNLGDKRITNRTFVSDAIGWVIAFVLCMKKN